MFQFTHPVWGATCDEPRGGVFTHVSIHAPRVGCDIITLKHYHHNERFNSRTPCGVRLTLSQPRSTVIVFQFTHPVWGATCWLLYKHKYQMCFNSRTPCGVRQRNKTEKDIADEFQFTHPVWGATPVNQRLESIDDVSIHAPRVGCDDGHIEEVTRITLFQFTHPVWGATASILGQDLSRVVSIHAPRVGCDTRKSQIIRANNKVSIHAPRVGCDSVDPSTYRLDAFQFTHPVWGATPFSALTTANS